jgi:catecholate siderophore receptor
MDADRWGVAATVGFGIGTDLEYNLSFFHQKDDRMLDYGIPVFGPGTYGTGPNQVTIDEGRPSSEFGVPRSNFYGLENDADDSQVDMLTGRLKYEANDWLTIYNDTRVSYYDRYWTPQAVGCNATCIGNYFDGLPGTVTRGGPSPTYQEGWAAQNVTTAVAKFDTGGLRHEFVAGLDMHTQHNERFSHSYWDGAAWASKPSTTLVDPDSSTSLEAVRNGGYGKSDAHNIGIFASDRVWLTEQLSISGGVRWDWYSVDSTTRIADNAPSNAGDVAATSSDSVLFNPKAAVIWEPTPDQTYYVSWARSATPQGLAVSTATGNSAAGQDGLDPEESENFEIGAKINLFDGRLGLSGAVFQTNKDNAFGFNENGDAIVTGEKQRVRGFEIGASGQVADAWTVTAAYTYLDPVILEGFGRGSVVPDPALEGNQIAYTPKHSFSLWTTYDASRHIEDSIGGKLLLATGVTYQSKVYLNNTNTSAVPENISWDAMVAYEKENWRLALNVKNITDRLNYSQVYSNRVVPSSGRTFFLTAGAKF